MHTSATFSLFYALSRSSTFVSFPQPMPVMSKFSDSIASDFSSPIHWLKIQVCDKVG